AAANGSLPDSARVETPIVALVRQEATVPATKRVTLPGESRPASRPHRRITRARPRSAWKVEPTATSTGTWSSINPSGRNALAIQEQRNTPGQARGPKTRRTPRDSPAGGQIGEANPGGSAKSSPSLAVKK